MSEDTSDDGGLLAIDDEGEDEGASSASVTAPAAQTATTGAGAPSSPAAAGPQRPAFTPATQAPPLAGQAGTAAAAGSFRSAPAGQSALAADPSPQLTAAPRPVEPGVPPPMPRLAVRPAGMQRRRALAPPEEEAEAEGDGDRQSSTNVGNEPDPRDMLATLCVNADGHALVLYAFARLTHDLVPMARGEMGSEFIREAPIEAIRAFHPVLRAYRHQVKDPEEEQILQSAMEAVERRLEQAAQEEGAARGADARHPLAPTGDQALPVPQHGQSEELGDLLYKVVSTPPVPIVLTVGVVLLLLVSFIFAVR